MYYTLIYYDKNYLNRKLSFFSNGNSVNKNSMILVILNFWGLFWGLLHVLSCRVFYAHFNEYGTVAVGWSVCTILSISVKSNWLTVLFQNSASWLISPLVCVFVIKSGAAKTAALTALCFSSWFCQFYYMYLEVPDVLTLLSL